MTCFPKGMSMHLVISFTFRQGQSPCSGIHACSQEDHLHNYRQFNNTKHFCSACGIGPTSAWRSTAVEASLAWVC